MSVEVREEYKVHMTETLVTRSGCDTVLRVTLDCSHKSMVC